MREVNQATPTALSDETRPSSFSTRFARRLDQVLLRGAITPSRRRRGRGPESLDHDQRMRSIGAIAAVYADPAWLDGDSGFFATPTPPTPQRSRLRDLPGGALWSLSWTSGFEPLWSTERAKARIEAADPDATADVLEALAQATQDGTQGSSEFRERYLRHTDNERVVARHYRHDDGARPTIILLHGYLGGHLPVEAKILDAERYYKGGMNVVLTTLPFHGSRKGPGWPLEPPRFPGSDPRFTVEGFRQAVLDLQTLVAMLDAESATEIGIAGMSLGGYTAALMATVEPRLSFALLRVPLGCLASFADATGRLVGSQAERATQRHALERVYRPISPLSRPPRVAPERTFVTTGSADLVTGPPQSRPLVQHFGASERHFPGGHLWQRAHARAQEDFFAMLSREGLWRRT